MLRLFFPLHPIPVAVPRLPVPVHCAVTASIRRWKERIHTSLSSTFRIFYIFHRIWAVWIGEVSLQYTDYKKLVVKLKNTDIRFQFSILHSWTFTPSPHPSQNPSHWQLFRVPWNRESRRGISKDFYHRLSESDNQSFRNNLCESG